jgi:hypothetical protein
MKLHIEGIGLIAPGLPNWVTGRAGLIDPASYRPDAVVLKPSELLPSAERRRMTDTVKLALAVASEALAQAGRIAEDIPTIFTSSGSDGATISAILEVLASPAPEVSPTRFHNSVHNAPAGYWSIASHAQAASTSLCGYDHSFGAGLLEAATQAIYENRPVLLVAYDLPYPPVFSRVRSINGIFGGAFVLSPRETVLTVASLSVTLVHGPGPETEMAAPTLEALRLGNPTARCLPLLAAIVSGTAQDVSLDHMGGNRLVLGVSPAMGTAS